MKKRGKKYLAAIALIEKDKEYTINEAVKLVKQTSFTKFNASVDLSINLNVDPKQQDQQIRGTLTLPHGNGKSKKILVVAQGSKVEEALAAGADYAGGKELLEKIQKENWFDFDIIVASLDMMAELGKLGKILGPKNLMPNPKAGTVTADVAKAVKEIKQGKIEYRVDKEANMHISIARTSFEEEKIIENFNTFLANLLKIRPSSVKGIYIKNIVLTTTMGPSIKLSIN